MLFPDASDCQVHIRWLFLLEDLEMCGGLSWGSAVLAWLYHQMCRATEHGLRNLGGCKFISSSSSTSSGILGGSSSASSSSHYKKKAYL
ncbi:hypothetical protein Ahy_A07g031842 [Arachis hypogaea]|uniref:Aminotransferase-like plant mobile domain-containing protein n=1 Tax=Arachis hypogaea TaxID=3818 RepID=A0A445C5C5_ARAHY|nr:hypothetical protein Ahy_A07g031842 [Arachis hypogaea]